MMYYSYLRKLDGRKYIGISIAINGNYASTVQSLFRLFEKTIEELAEEGTFIHYTDNGDLTTSVDKFTDEEYEINAILTKFKRKFESIRGFQPLPPVDFSVSKDSVRLFTTNDKEFDIVHSSFTYGCTFIYKDADYETVRTLSHRAVLKKLNNENEELKEQNAQLQSLNTQIQRQKKQFRKVIILCIFLFISLIGVIFLFLHLYDTQRKLDWANNEVYEKSNDITEKREKIDSLTLSNDSLDCALHDAILNEEQALNYLNSTTEAYPFIVTESEVSTDSYTFKYIANESDEKTVYLKAININNGQVYTNSHTINIRKGTHSVKLYFDYYLNYSSTYYVVLSYNNHIIAGIRW